MLRSVIERIFITMISLRAFSLAWHCIMKSNWLTTLYFILNLTFLANCCIIFSFTKCSRRWINLQNHGTTWTVMFLFLPSCTSSCTLFFFYFLGANTLLPVNADDRLILSPDEYNCDIMQVTKKKHHHLPRKFPMPVWFLVLLFALCVSDVLVERMIE